MANDSHNRLIVNISVGIGYPTIYIGLYRTQVGIEEHCTSKNYYLIDIKPAENTD